MIRKCLVPAVLTLGLHTMLAAPPQRIISLSPSVTEILDGIGAFPRVVAVSEYCTYPPAVKSLPRVGGWHTPNLERLMALRPDLVILAEAQTPFILDQLQQLGIRTLVTRSQSVADALESIAAIGKATGNEREAALVAAAVRTGLERVRARAAGLPRSTVLCIVDRTPGTLRDLNATAQGSFLTELLEAAGGKVITAPARRGYGKISKETVLAANPEIILEMAHGARRTSEAELKAAWRELPEIRAVRRGRIYEVREEYVPHASQFIAKTAVLLARLLHPEVPVREWEAR